MTQVFLNLEDLGEGRYCDFVGEVLDDNLILHLAMPRDFLSEKAEYYLVTENRKKKETVFLDLLAKRDNTLIFSVPAELVFSPLLKFFVAAYSREERRVCLIREKGPVYLFLEQNLKGETA